LDNLIHNTVQTKLDEFEEPYQVNEGGIELSGGLYTSDQELGWIILLVMALGHD
jgi:hypothetical protein